MHNKPKIPLTSEFPLFQTYRSYSISFNLSNVGEIFWGWIRKDRRKEIVCVVFTYSIKQAREIKKFHVASRATTAKRDARAKLLFC